MNTLSPYTIRCNNPVRPINDRYEILDKIGELDTYILLKKFITSHTDDFTIVDRNKQVFKFSNTQFDDNKRYFTAWFEVGNYGTRNDIINIDTGLVDFTKTIKNAEIIKHFILFYLPEGCNEGISLLHSYRGHGIKTLFYSLFAQEFNAKTNLILQMNPLSYKKAFNDWKNANTKEIRLIQFSGLSDVADQIEGLGHKEQVLTLKPPRAGTLGKLMDYFKPDTEQSKAIEFLTPLCRSVKSVVEQNGKKRTFIIGNPNDNAICTIEFPEDLELIDGNPEYDSTRKWCIEIANEYAAEIYSGTIKI